LAAFRALGIGWDRDLLAGIGKTAADLVFADAELRFHKRSHDHTREPSRIKKNLRPLSDFLLKATVFHFAALIIESIDKMS
jgi:hypothetical protein